MSEPNLRSSHAPVLSLRGVAVKYGSVLAVRGIDIDVAEREIVALIGSNGAGKTTTLSAIAGLVPLHSGEISLGGTAISRLPTERRVALGISLVQEGRQVVPQLTVQENLRVGAFLRRDSEIETDLERIYAIFPRLSERRAQHAGLMSGGEQQMLAIGRALMARPKVLLLDEPSMGLAPLVIETIFETLAEISRSGVTLLLVEQNARMALRLAHRAYVLERGNIAISGPAAELVVHPKVIEAYLGGSTQRL